MMSMLTEASLAPIAAKEPRVQARRYDEARRLGRSPTRDAAVVERLAASGGAAHG
jgi:hypothetical protein